MVNAKEETSDFVGNPDHVTLRLGLLGKVIRFLLGGGHRRTSHGRICYSAVVWRLQLCDMSDLLKGVDSRYTTLWNVNVRKLPWLTGTWRTISIVSSPCVCSGSDAACPRAADIVLALDQSTSIVSGYSNYDTWYENMLGFAATFAQSFPISPNLTRVSYSQCG